MGVFLTMLVNFLSTDAAKTLIALAVNKLLNATGDGITKEIANTMVEGIAKSKANPTTTDVFNDAITLLKGA